MIFVLLENDIIYQGSEYENIDMSKWVSDIAEENNLPTDGSVCVLIE
jgi:hypothetical protein